MLNQFSRTQLLLGAEAMEKLKGRAGRGVRHRRRGAAMSVRGSSAAAWGVRSGRQRQGLPDESQPPDHRHAQDCWQVQGRRHARAGCWRSTPDCDVRVRKCFYLPETAAEFNFSDYDYVVDAVDTVTAKVTLVLEAQKAGVPIISCMGAGNKARSLPLPRGGHL